MNKIAYTNEFLEQVTSFGILGYSAEKIIALINPDNPERFLLDFDTPGYPVHKAFMKGKTTGEYTLDKNLFDMAKASNIDANRTVVERFNYQKVSALIYTRFGV
jgi:hypothetical protein